MSRDREDGPAVDAVPAGRAPCRACGGEAQIDIVGAVPATHPGPFEQSDYRLLYCHRCEVTYLDPLPTQRDLRTLYEDSVQFADETYTDPGRVAQILAYYGSCLDNHKMLPPPGGRALEVGAGLAWVSRACKAREEAVRTVAQDVTSECADRCPWVDEYVVGPLSRIPPEPAFHLISMTHVIEHLEDPGATFAQLARRLVPRGRMLVTAPYRPTGWSPGQGVNAWLEYSYLHVPAHIHYLTETWFRLIAERCGLRLAYWFAGHEEGQAFEAVLEQA